MAISRRRLLTAGGGLLLAAGAGGGGYALLSGGRPDGGSADTAARDAADAAAIGRLLDRRAAAVLRRDRAALLATVQPGATGLRTRQAAWLDGLAQLPLAAWDYRLLALDAYPLPAALGTGADRRRATRVQLSYRLAGFDSEPVTATQYLTFARVGGDWYLGSDTDHPGGDVQLWDLGPVTAVRGQHCLVLGLGPAAQLRPYAELADRAVPAVSAVWGDGWGQRTVLLVPSTADQFGSLLGVDPRDFAGTAAVTSGEYGAAEGRRTERITVNPPVWAELSALGRQVVTTHETTHVATRAVTDTWTPRWLAEGAANWTGYLGTGLTPRQVCPELAASVAAGYVPGQLPADSAFDGTAPDLARTYELAWFACRSIVLRHGEAGLAACYRDVAATGGTGGEQAAVEQALLRATGTGLAGFTALWRADLLAALR